MQMPPLIDSDPLSDSESDDEGSAHHAGDGSEDADATRRRPERKLRKKTYWNVSSIEEKILPAEFANRNFLRTYGAGRVTTFIGMKLSDQERAMIGARYAGLPGNIDREGKSGNLWRCGLHSLCWEFGIHDRGLPLRAWRDLQKGKLKPAPIIPHYKMDKFRDEFDRVLEMQTTETGHRQLLAWYNAMEATEEVCLNTFQKMMKRENVVGKTRQAIPSLMSVHKIERMAFSAEHIHKEGIWIHIDEKNFKAIEIGKGKVYIGPRMSEKKVLELTTKVSIYFLILTAVYLNS